MTTLGVVSTWRGASELLGSCMLLMAVLVLKPDLCWPKDAVALISGLGWSAVAYRQSRARDRGVLWDCSLGVETARQLAGGSRLMLGTISSQAALYFLLLQGV